MKQQIIALADGNNFFANCEIIKNPSLSGKPVCVLSNNDGCVIARTNEAKRLGIKMGMPYFMAKKDFPTAYYLSADFAFYHECSCRMKKFLKNYSDKIDIYSIDEAFFDITGLNKVYNMSYLEITKKIKHEIESATGVNVSVGAADTKTLAKVAVNKAKLQSGYYYIPFENIQKELYKLDIEEIWGIGKNFAHSFKKFGIFYAHQFRDYDNEFFRVNFGKKGTEIKCELTGISALPVTGIEIIPKSIQRTRAFPDFSTDKSYIKTEISMHLHNACKKIRSYGLSANITGVMLRTKDFRIFYKDTKVFPALNSEINLTKIIFNLFEQIYIPGIIYRSSGVILSDLSDSETSKPGLFDLPCNKTDKLNSTIDKLEDKFGKGIIAQGEFGIKDIKSKHERKTGIL